MGGVVEEICEREGEDEDCGEEVEERCADDDNDGDVDDGMFGCSDQKYVLPTSLSISSVAEEVAS